MKYKNDYKPPPGATIPEEEQNRETSQEDYDFNFVHPVALLKSDRVELRPTVPSLHAKLLSEGIQDPDLFPYDDWDASEEGTYANLETFRRSPSILAHVIYTAPLSNPNAPPSEYVMAGMANIHHVDATNLGAALGIAVFPSFHRTHVSTHAVGLMLKRILDMLVPQGDSPVSAAGGWGYRRVDWRCNTCNLPSIRAAARMGFRRDGILRNAEVLNGKDKIAESGGRPGDLQDGKKSNYAWMSSITWQDWEDGGRELVEKQMARRSYQ